MALNKGKMYTDPPVRRNLDYYYDTTGDYYEEENTINTNYGVGARTRTTNRNTIESLNIINSYLRIQEEILQGAEDAF